MIPLYDGPCISIGGAPRSGTTLVRQLLMAHPDAGILLEDRLTDVVRTVQSLASIRVESEDAARATLFGETRSFLGVPAVFAAEGLRELNNIDSYRERFATLLPQVIGAVLGRKPPRVLGAKLPIFEEWEDTAFLRRCFSDFRMIFIVRNPLDTINSSLARRNKTREGQDQWPIETVADAYAQWRTAIRRVADEISTPSARALVVKYDCLCDQPEKEERRLREFAGLEDLGQLYHQTYPAETRRPAMSEDDLAQALDLIGERQVDELWKDLSPERLALHFSETAAPYRIGSLVELSAKAAAAFLTSGFSWADEWGRWTDGTEASFALRFEGRIEPARLHIHVGPLFLRLGEKTRRVEAWINGKLLRATAVHGSSELIVEIPAGGALASGRCDVRLLVDGAKTPLDPGADPRAIGIGLTSFVLDWA